MDEGMVTMVKHPEILVKVDCAGNDFSILDTVTKAMRRAGIPAEEIELFCDEVMSGDDRDLLRICGRWVTLVS
jgi:hypothetical protein